MKKENIKSVSLSFILLVAAELIKKQGNLAEREFLVRLTSIVPTSLHQLIFILKILLIFVYNKLP